MEGHLLAVLLMGGGEGMGPIEATARALSDALYKERLGEPIGQVLVICGWSKCLRHYNDKVFVTKMEECMGARDCIIIKAGPGTIAEVMIRGLPIILNGYIAGIWKCGICYRGNSHNHQKRLDKIVGEWFGPRQDELSDVSQCFKASKA